MKYLIFDNDIYYESKDSSGILPKDKIGAILKDSDKEFKIAVIDTLQKQLAAPEKQDSKKDEVIASSFTGDYVIQSERIGRNLFQVIAIEKSKINEIYKHLGFENVRFVLPYGVAIREFLKGNNLFGQNKRIVFLDYMGNQVLLTIFNNEVFTTPRRLSVAAARRLASEVTRSEENYKTLNKEEKDINFLIATNSKEIIEEIASSGLDLRENIVYFPEKYPALKGLGQGKFSMHYMLPEQFIRLRKLKNFRRRITNLAVLIGILGVFFIALFGTFSVNRIASMRLDSLRLEEASLKETLKSAYRAKYKDILMRKKKINFPYFIDSFIKALPFEYRVESITISDLSGTGYRFEAIVSCETKDKPMDRLILPPLFRKARIENILIKNRPGVRVVMDIF